jgi:hypothetical protein
MTIASSTLAWLLAAPTPSIRYFTLTRLMDCTTDDPAVTATQQEMRITGPLPAITAGQTKRGNWAGDHSYYTPKYTSTHWAMLLLAELGADESHESMRCGAESMLRDAARDANRLIDRTTADLACFWGNLLRYCTQAGFQSDSRLRAVVDLMVRGALSGGWRCVHNGGEPCAWGAARALWGLAALSNPDDFPGVKDAIADGLRFLLGQHSLQGANYPVGQGHIHPMWFDLNFPLFYQADILFVLRVLADLGALAHPGAQPALAWLRGQRKANGRFAGASPYRTRTYAAMGAPEETARWVTLQAEWILQQSALRTEPQPKGC